MSENPRRAYWRKALLRGLQETGHTLTNHQCEVVVDHLFVAAEHEKEQNVIDELNAAHQREIVTLSEHTGARERDLMNQILILRREGAHAQ